MGAKKKPILPHEKFYIEQNPDNLSIPDLAKMFNRAEQVVRNIVVKYKTKLGTKKVYNKQVEEVQNELTACPTPAATEQPKTTGIQVQPLMGRASRNGVVEATIMTQAASEAGDEARKANRRPISQILKGSIRKCKE
jgi:hypothetical protein